MSDTDPEIHRTSDRLARRTPRPLRMRRRLLGVAAFLASVAAVAAVVLASLHVHLPFGLSSTPPAHSATTGATGTTGVRRPIDTRTITVSPLGSLATPASRMAAVPFGTGGVLFFGGLDASGSPIDTVQNFQAATATNAGTLPAPDASAVAAALGANIYLFGGASSTIYQLTGTSFSVAGSLPAATADAAVATVAGTAYVIGGYTGSAELDTIVAYTPNAPGNVTGSTTGTATGVATTQIVATLPVALRFPAAAAIGGQVYIAGGSTAGIPSATVYRFDPTTDVVTTVATLPHARDRESAAALRGTLYVIGGTNAAGVRTRAIYAVNPASGSVRLAGILPLALSDTTAVSGSGEIIIAGGLSAAAAPSAAIYGMTVSGS
jgi:Kelch motif